MSPQGFHALVVDNDPVFLRDALRLVKDRFHRAGLEVTVFSCDGVAAASDYLTGTQTAPFDVVFVDMRMPPAGRPKAPENEHEPLGLDVVTMASEAGVPVIVGYSQASHKELAALERDVYSYGGHRFYYRGTLFTTLAASMPIFIELASLLSPGGSTTGPRRATTPPARLGSSGQADGAGAQPALDARRVAVVHGRDIRRRLSLFEFLRSLDLAPVEWVDAISFTGQGTPTIPSILDRLFERAQAVVVLFTPDEEVRLTPGVLKPGEGDEAGRQPRPNVYLEAGMALARYPERTVLVEIGDVRPASDLAGRFILRLDNGATSRQALVRRLVDAGCAVRAGTDWLTAGDFA